jgi:hypothetical protein
MGEICCSTRTDWPRNIQDNHLARKILDRACSVEPEVPATSRVSSRVFVRTHPQERDCVPTHERGYLFGYRSLSRTTSVTHSTE